jgi:hypothetical protein
LCAQQIDIKGKEMYKIGNNAFGKLSYVYSVGVELFIIIVTGWNHSVTLRTVALRGRSNCVQSKTKQRQW